MNHRFRAGLAPLEVAIVLPVIAVLMICLFWLCNVGNTHIQTISDAKRVALQQRHENDVLSEASPIAVPGGNSLKKRLRLDKTYHQVRPHLERPVNPMFRFFEDVAITSQAASQSLVQTLDYRTLPQSRHAELTFPEEFLSLGIDRHELKKFRQEFDRVGGGRVGLFSSDRGLRALQGNTLHNLEIARNHVTSLIGQLEPDEDDRRSELERKLDQIKDAISDVQSSKLPRVKK